MYREESDRPAPFLPPYSSMRSMGIDMEAKTLTVLAPCAGALPGRYFVLGDIKWVE